MIMISLVSVTGCTTSLSSTHDRAVDLNEKALKDLTPAINDTVVVSYSYDDEGVTVRSTSYDGRTVVVYTRVQ